MYKYSPDVVPPIHAVSSHVVTDKPPPKMAASSGLFLATIYNQSQRVERKQVARYWLINTAATAVPLSAHLSPLVITTKLAATIFGGGCTEEVFCRPSTAPVVCSTRDVIIMTPTQICINILYPDAVPPIHGESYHVASDKGPSIDGGKFKFRKTDSRRIGIRFPVFILTYDIVYSSACHFTSVFQITTKLSAAIFGGALYVGGVLPAQYYPCGHQPLGYR